MNNVYFKTKISFIVLVGVFLLGCVQQDMITQDNSTYEYKAILNEKSDSALDFNLRYFYIDTQRHAVFIGHAGYPYKNCSVSNLCIFSFIFNFAIPKFWTPENKKWNVSGFEFSLKKEVILNINNKEVHAFEIEVTNQSDLNDATVNLVTVYYSKKSGILGFIKKFLNKDNNKYFNVTYLLSSDTGYLSNNLEM